MTPLVIAAVVAAGAAGAALRWLVSGRFSRADQTLPWAVLLVNIAGSLVAGLALAISETLGAPDVRLIVLGGFAGGLTTFGTLSLETVQLLLGGRVRTAVLSIVANLVAGIAAFLIGWGAVTLVAGLSV